MQQYQLQISPTAKSQINNAYSYIFKDSPQNANAWLKGMHQTIHSLQTLPFRCGRIQESNAFQGEYRQIFHYSHRIIFMIDQESLTVSVVAVRHGAQKNLEGHGS